MAELPPIEALKLDNDDDASFVVLSGEPFSGLYTKDEFPPLSSDPISLQTVSFVETKQEVGSNTSFDDTQKQLEQVLDENIRLKKTIHQNTLAMEKQHASIVQWRNDVTVVLQKHKEKLKETEETLKQNKTSHEKLQNEVEKYKKIKELQDEEIINLKSNLFKNVEPTSFVNISDDKDVVEKNAEIEQLKLKIEQLNRTTVLDQEKLDLESKLKNEEIINLKEEILQLQKAQCTQEKQLANELFDLKQKFADLEREINLKDIKIAKLENEKCEIEEEKEQLDTLKPLLEKSQYDLFELQQQNKYLTEQLVQLQTELLTNKQMLEVSKINLNEKINEVNTLNEKSSENFAIVEQMHQFKADYEAEREIRMTIEEQKKQIADDLINVQRRNYQLQQEIDVLRDGNQRGFVVCSQETSNRGRRSEAREEPNNTPKYVCPKCDFGFKTQQAVLNHVERCLDMDSFP